MLTDERLLNLREVSEAMRPLDLPWKVNTIRYWIRHGIDGIYLESVKIGRRYYTSREAIARFAARLSSHSVPLTGLLPSQISSIRESMGRPSTQEGLTVTKSELPPTGAERWLEQFGA